METRDNGLTYTTPNDITDARVDYSGAYRTWDRNRSHGGKLPTPYKVTLSDNRERRVYVMAYGSGTVPYVRVGGVDVMVDDATQDALAYMHASGRPYAPPIPTTEPEPTSGKFGDVAAEAAYELSLDGMSQEFGDVAVADGWNALVHVSPTVLLDAGHGALSRTWRYWHAFSGGMHADITGGALVWIREDAQGNVRTVMWGDDGDTTSGTDAVTREWNRMAETADDGRCTECGNPEIKS